MCFVEVGSIGTAAGTTLLFVLEMPAGKDKECNFLEEYCVAPAPSRDYYGIKVTSTQVILFLWKVTRRTSGLPIVRRETLEDYARNPSIQNEVHRIFGRDIADEITAIARGERSYLPHLPQDVLTQILLQLDLNDLARLAQVCSKLHQATNSSALWQQLFHKHNHSLPTVDQSRRANLMGWKRFFRTSFQHQVKSRPSPPLPSTSSHRKLSPRTQSGISARSSRSAMAESSHSAIATPTKNFRIFRGGSKVRERSPFLASKFKEIADRGKKLSVQVLYTASAMAHRVTSRQRIAETPSELLTQQEEKEVGATSLSHSGSKVTEMAVSSEARKTGRRPNTTQVSTSETVLGRKSSSLMRLQSATSHSLEEVTRKSSRTWRKTLITEKKMADNEETVRNTSVDEEIVRKTSVDETAVGKTSVDETAVGKTSVDETAVRKTSVDETALGKTSVDEKASVDETAVGKTSVDKKAVGKTSVDETALGKTSVHETALGKTSVDETAVGKTSDNKKAVGKTLVDEKVVRKSVDNEKVVRKSVDNEKAVRKTSFNEKAVRKTSFNEKTVRKTSVNEKVVRNTSVNEKAGKKSPDNEKGVKKISDNEKVMRKPSYDEKTVRKSPGNERAMIKTPGNERAMIKTPGNERAMIKTPDKEKIQKITLEKQSKMATRIRTSDERHASSNLDKAVGRTSEKSKAATTPNTPKKQSKK